jgi:hypothetical protein
MRVVDLDRIAKNGKTVRQNREATRDPGLGWARRRCGCTERAPQPNATRPLGDERAAANQRLL